MKKTVNWPRFIFHIGVVTLLLGALDPLEGSIIVILGSFLLAFATYKTQDRHRTYFLTISLLIFSGVVAMVILSILGGFGGTSMLSWWWSLFILPYPIGWLWAVSLLIIRKIRKTHRNPVPQNRQV